MARTPKASPIRSPRVGRSPPRALFGVPSSGALSGTPSPLALVGTLSPRALFGAAALSALLPAPAIAQSVFELDEIVFTSNLARTQAERSGVSVEVVTAEDLAAGGDIQLSDYLARLPGLNVTRDGPVGQNSFPRIRGLDGRYISVRINGIDISDPSLIQNQTNFGGLTTAGISRVEVLYGSQSALYGSEAVAGVIDIRTTAIPDAVGDAATLSVEGGSFGTGQVAASYALRGERGGLAVSATRLVSEGFSAAEENDGNTEEDGHRNSLFTFSGTYDVTEAITLGVDIFAQDTFTEFDSAAGPGGDGPETQDVTQQGARLRAEIDGDLIDHDISLSGFRTERYFPLGFTQDFNGTRGELRYLGIYDFGVDNTLSFGLERSVETFEDDTNSGSIFVNSAFADATFAVTPDLDITVSGRLDDHSRFGTQSSLRAAIAFRPDADTVIRASIGEGTRAPSLFELFSAFGDPALSPEESLSVELGAERRFGALDLGVTAFWIEVDDLIGFDTASVACGSGFGCYNQVPGRTTTQGIELSAAYALSDRLRTFGTYTYTDTETAAGGRLPRVPRHLWSVGLSGEIVEDWRLSVTGIGAADTAVSAFAPNALDDYIVFDASLGYEIMPDIEAYLRIDNLFDEQYQTSPGYGTSDRAFYVGLRAAF